MDSATIYTNSTFYLANSLAYAQQCVLMYLFFFHKSTELAGFEHVCRQTYDILFAELIFVAMPQ